MQSRFPGWRSVFVLTLIAVASNARGKTAMDMCKDFPIIEPASAMQVSDNPQQLAYAPPAADQNRPPDYSALAAGRSPTRIWRNASRTWRKRWQNTPKPPMRPSLNRRPSPDRSQRPNPI